MTKYELHPEAIVELDDILGFIANDSPDAAHRIASEMADAFRMISQFSAAGHLRPDLTSRSLRFHTVREYLIAYAPDKTPTLILAVIHGRRSPHGIAAILNGRR